MKLFKTKKHYESWDKYQQDMQFLECLIFQQSARSTMVPKVNGEEK